MAAEKEFPSKQDGIKVKANLLLASNGATSVAAKSAPLRTAEDGRRFHEIRQDVKAILVGGNTFQREPYLQSRIPVLVASSHLPATESVNLTIINLSPVKLTELALKKFGVPVLVEGGPNFLSSLISNQIIDQLYISRVPKLGDGDFFDLKHLAEHYQLQTAISEHNTIFETWVPKRVAN